MSPEYVYRRFKSDDEEGINQFCNQSGYFVHSVTLAGVGFVGVLITQIRP